MIKKDYFNVSHAVISEDNVQRIAELISLRALKMLCQFSQKAFVRLYKGLIRDVYYPDVYSNHIFVLISWIFGWAILPPDWLGAYIRIFPINLCANKWIGCISDYLNKF